MSVERRERPEEIGTRDERRAVQRETRHGHPSTQQALSYHIASSLTGLSPHGLSVPLLHGKRGKCTTAPVMGSVCVVVTLKSVKLSSAVSLVAVDVTVPLTATGPGLAGIGIATGALVGYDGGTGSTTSSPCVCACAGGGGEPAPLGKLAYTADRGGDTSPTSTRLRPGRWSSNEIELECASDPPLPPVGPLEWLECEGRDELEPVCVCLVDAAAEPEGLRDECGLRCERIECNDPRSE